MNAPRRVIESTTSLPLSSTPPTPKNSEPIFTNATGRVGNGPLTVTVQLPDVVGETVELNSDGTGVVLPELLEAIALVTVASAGEVVLGRVSNRSAVDVEV